MLPPNRLKKKPKLPQLLLLKQQPSRQNKLLKLKLLRLPASLEKSQKNGHLMPVFVGILREPSTAHRIFCIRYFYQRPYIDVVKRCSMNNRTGSAAIYQLGSLNFLIYGLFTDSGYELF
ncbi:hypothetical protein [Bartonella choladocola]|uniref:hypothetical protein n=1 Tax=Bartonella choladocola TaxID=2750995 RepID=UPI00122E150C|nr:hypothetical protein [Bartonella choladocola]